jgi:hypothetical protein
MSPPTDRLNEGFASWTENFAIDHLYPDWLVWEQFTIDAQNAALNLDSLRTSHPIQVGTGLLTATLLCVWAWVTNLGGGWKG